MALKPAWRISFSPTFTPFHLPRKVAAHEGGDRRERGTGKRTGGPQGPRQWRTVASVGQAGPVETVCVEVDSPSRMFLAGRAMVPVFGAPTAD